MLGVSISTAPNAPTSPYPRSSATITITLAAVLGTGFGSENGVGVIVGVDVGDGVEVGTGRKVRIYVFRIPAGPGSIHRSHAINIAAQQSHVSIRIRRSRRAGICDDGCKLTRGLEEAVATQYLVTGDARITRIGSTSALLRHSTPCS